MKLYIPLATGQFIPNKVLTSLAHQTIPLDIVPCCTPGVIQPNCRGTNQVQKVIGELASRNLALDLIKASGEKYALMQDRDVIHIFNSNYATALAFMECNPDVGIVALPWKDYKVTDHIRMQALIIRVAALKDFIFRQDDRHHVCMTMKEDMISAGWRCEFLPSQEKMIWELIEP